MEYKIYKLVSPSNKIYIGKTKNLEIRLKKHASLAASGINRHLYDAIRKYRIENFTVSIIEENLNQIQSNEREIFWIDYYKSTDRSVGYNMTPGGDVLINYSIEEKKEIWKKQGLARKGKTRSPEFREKMKIASKIRENNYSEEKRKEISKKISDTNKRKGIKRPIHHNGNGGHKHTEDSKIKISLARKGKTMEEMMGKEKAQKLKNDMKEKYLGSGNPHWKELSNTQRLKILEDLKLYYNLTLKQISIDQNMSLYVIRKFLKEIDIENLQILKQKLKGEDWILFFQSKINYELSRNN